MKFLSVAKDGGPESRVTGYWLIELKWLFSIVLLRFDNGSREMFHSHAFNSVSWILNREGELHECHLRESRRRGGSFITYFRSWRPIWTYRTTFHQVYSIGTTWVLSFRGPWHRAWREYHPLRHEYTTLTNGRVPV